MGLYFFDIKYIPACVKFAYWPRLSFLRPVFQLPREIRKVCYVNKYLHLATIWLQYTCTTIKWISLQEEKARFNSLQGIQFDATQVSYSLTHF